MLRARAQLALGRSLEARPDLRRLLDTELGDEARYWLAEGALDRGELEPALATYRRVWADSTRGPWSDRAATRLLGLEHPVPDTFSPEGRALVQMRIAALDSARRYDEALELRRAIYTGGGRLTMARACFDGRDYAAAVVIYRELLGEPNKVVGSARDLFEYALAASRIGDFASARRIYQALMSQHPADSRADTASFKLGYLHADRGEWPEARAEFEAHLTRFPGSGHADEALWWIGWSHFTSGEWVEAKAAFDRLQRARPQSGLVPAAAYWTARVDGMLGDAEAQRKGLETVLTTHPHTGYAWFAAERLGATYPPRPEAVRPEWPADIGRRGDVQRFEVLLSFGLQQEARAELVPVASHLASGGREAGLATAWALIEAGAYKQGQAIARKYCGDAGSTSDPVAEQACWPRPAWPVVRATAARYGVPVLVPFGVMTTESALDPSVVSLAGARGLMQLMPVEAEGLHRDLYGDRPYHPDLLFSAPYNASLGVAELGTKQRLLGDVLDGPDIVASIAAYNGGEEAVNRWVATFDGAPPFDVFAESIGYTETRRYVRKVLGTVMTYRLGYGEPSR
jgi:soluble lytic murein transglycosylase